MMIAGDNPPVGILLCTRMDHALVEYALADMDNRLFVSKYQLELPSREEIQRFVEAQIGRAQMTFQILTRAAAITAIIRDLSISPKCVSTYRVRICKGPARNYAIKRFPER